MSDEKRIPGSRWLVAGFYFVSGVLAVIDTFLTFTRGHLSINFGVLGLFIGAGFLRLSPTWRAGALVLNGITLVLAPIVAVLVLITARSLHFNLFGQRVAEVPKSLGVAVVAVVFLIALWQDRVLRRPAVRGIFRSDAN